VVAVDAVYIMGPGRSPELPYSLRSLPNLRQVDRVVMVGARPPGLRDVVHVPATPARPGKHWSTWANWRAAAASPLISDDFVLMNDDFMVMRPVDVLPVYEAGPLVELGAPRDSARADRRSKVADLLTAMGIVPPLGGGFRSFELHIPMPVNRAALADVLDRAEAARHRDYLPAGKRSLYGNAVGLAGVPAADVKIRDFDTVPPDDATFVSTHEWYFSRGAVGRWVRERLPEPSRWER
jgi:hypothetical protein